MEHSSGGPSADGQGVRLVHEAGRERYEALDGDEVVAVLYYADEPAPGDAGAQAPASVRDLRSTVVAPERNGEGLGSALVRHVLDEARADGLAVRPTCWFVDGWIRRHPEYMDLLEPGAQAAQPSQADGGPER